MFSLNLWENQIPIKAAYSKCVEGVCKKYGLTRSEFDILMFLSKNPKYDTAADIVEIKRMTKSHVSASVKNLEKDGYISGRYTEGNKKTIHLSLSEKSGEVVKDGKEAIKSFTDMVFKEITREETEEFWRTIAKMQKNINDYLEGKKQ